VGYARLTYLTAYLKTHYPIEYLASLISVRNEDKDGRKQDVLDAIVRGIKIHVPDINISTNVCTIIDDTIYLPLAMVRGVGTIVSEAIISERSKGEYKSITDFFERVDRRQVNKNVRRNLAKAGAFDGLYDRSALLQKLFNAGNEQLIAMEKEMLGLYVSGNISEAIWYDYGAIHISEINELALDDEFTTVGIIEKVHEHVDKNGNVMAFISLEDNTGQLEVVIFSDQYNCVLAVGDVIFLTAKLDQYDPPKPSKAIAMDFVLLHSQVLG
jgi:DNA polymerase-3 subunit alpha